ncbi:DUF3265 domain-containing protein [Vibrio vulnificus]|nr:DUF3265 domain-containing protein [Vibrio vulnificus]EIT7122087.1 DUF3265 domain-containing protein [Vibrio vulnificus]EJB1779253.1 DUF3265 domain-containing protein [Vibrio vulnificus]ELQ2514679.1 DUF3265 domain-containing protein [Vibrio vulnificus]ELX4144450.1 DUF3265 domain-containing protein [Vibrio vulnificus]
MTKRLSGIWHAWHFQFALGSVIKSLCGSFCSACLHPLTQRYVYLYFKGLNVLGLSSLSLWQFVPSRLSKSVLSA